MPRERNERLLALLAEAGWSRAQAAAAYNHVVREHGHDTVATIGRSHVSMWVGGTSPTGAAPVILCQALSRRLNRHITPGELGFPSPDASAYGPMEWHTDPLITLADLGRLDLDPERRNLLAGAVFSAVSPALPEEAWWRATAVSSPGSAPRERSLVGREDVQAVHQLTIAFSRIDQRHGGGHGRKAIAQYLNSDIAALLRGRFADDQVRRDMFAAAGELAYLCGWMAFDDSQQGLAQRYFDLALKLTARSGDAPLAGHILRAMAHQANDLGHPRLSLELSSASMDGQRYLSASPRERALLGVVHARGLAATGQKAAAAKALLRAEDDLRAADTGIQEPPRTFFFGEAALAHEAGCTLRDSGDLQAAIAQFRRSVLLCTLSSGLGLPCVRVEADSDSTYVAYICSLGSMKMTGALERVLQVFLSDPDERRYGYDLMKAAKLPSGTLYPLLARLQGEGLVKSEWEAPREDAGGRPPRRYYHLTGEGVRVARLELAQLSLDASRGSAGTPRPATGGAAR